MNRYDNLMGNALMGPGYAGYGGYGAAVFGQDGGGVMPLPQGGAAMVPPGLGNPGFAGPWDGGCWGNTALVNPTFQQRRLFSGILGAQCGPLLQQQYLPFEDVGCIRDCEEVDIRAFPQVWGKLVRFIIPRSQASSFVVTGAFVGITNLFAANGIVPAEAMEPEAEGVLMSTFSFFPNQPVILRVKNISGADAICTPTAIAMTVSGGYPQLYGTPLGGT